MIVLLFAMFLQYRPLTTADVPDDNITITNCDGCYTSWMHPLDVGASQSIENNVDTIGDTSGKNPCEYQGRYDPGTKACVLVIRFAKMDHLVCTALEPAQKQDDDDIIPKGVTQQLTCMYDPKE